MMDEKNIISKMPSCLFVDWQLTDGNYIISKYENNQSFPKNSNNQNHDLECVTALLNFNYPKYIFNIYGDNTYEYIYKIDLIKYIVCSGREARIIVHTYDVNRGANFIKDISSCIPAHMLCLAIHLQPSSDIQALLLLIGLLNDCKQYCRIHLEITPDNVENSKLWLKYLNALQHKIYFGLEFDSPQAFACEFSSASHLYSKQLPEWCQPVQAVNPINEYACCGTSVVHVTPEGRLCLGLLANDEPYKACIIENPVLLPGLPAPISFQTLHEAQEWLDRFVVWQLSNVLNGGSIRHPSKRVSAEDNLRFGLARVKSEANKLGPLPPQPLIWYDGLPALIELFSTFDKPPNRDIFLRLIKAHVLGDSSYLKDESAMNQFSLLAVGNTPLEIHPHDIRAAVELLQWSGRPFSMALPRDAGWLETLRILRFELPDYELFLSQTGLQTSVAGLRLPIGRRHVPRGMTQECVSFIIVPNDAGSGLKQMFASLLRRAIHIQFVIMLAGREDPAWDAAAELAGKYPAFVLARDITVSCGMGEAFIRGMDMADGDFICFLRGSSPADVPYITKALDALKSESAIGIVAPFPQQGDSQIAPDNLAAQSSTWNGNWLLCRRKLASENNALPWSLDNQLDLKVILTLLCLAANKTTVIQDDRQAGHPGLSAGYFFACLDLGVKIKQLYPAKNSVISQWLANVLKQAAPAINLASLNVEKLFQERKFPSSAIVEFPSLLEMICGELGAEAWMPHIYYKDEVEFAVVVSRVPASMPHVSLVMLFDANLEAETIRESLDRLLSMSHGDMEFVLVDHSRDMEIGLLLESYAALAPNFTLLRADADCHPAACALAGARHAAGEFVGFIEPRDEPSNELAEMLASCRDGDIHIYGIHRIGQNGISEFPFFADQKGTGSWAAGTILAQRLPLEIAGVFFRRGWLNRHENLLSIRAGDWEAAFLTGSLLHAAVSFHEDSAGIRREKTYETSLQKLSGSDATIYANLDRLAGAAWSLESLLGALEWCVHDIRVNWLPYLASGFERIPLSRFFMLALLLEYSGHRDFDEKRKG